jgi:hypothetical protein
MYISFIPNNCLSLKTKHFNTGVENSNRIQPTKHHPTILQTSRDFTGRLRAHSENFLNRHRIHRDNKNHRRTIREHLRPSVKIGPYVEPATPSLNGKSWLINLFLCPVGCAGFFNHLTPNGHFSGRTAPLTYRCSIFYLFNKYTYWIF